MVSDPLKSGEQHDAFMDVRSHFETTWNKKIPPTVNGYCTLTSGELKNLEYTCGDYDFGELHVCIQTGVQVCFSRRVVTSFERLEGNRRVSQVFCSAMVLPRDFDKRNGHDFIVDQLAAEYEAAILAGVFAKHKPSTIPSVYLTFLGGSAFCNPMEWIYEAITEALARTAHIHARVYIVHLKEFDENAVKHIKKDGKQLPKGAPPV
jgi:hypothetical protein